MEDLDVLKQRIERREDRVRQRVEMFGVDRGQAANVHAAKGGADLYIRAHVDDDVMPAGSETRANLLREVLDTRRKRDALEADHTDAHSESLGGYPDEEQAYALSLTAAIAGIP